MSRLIDLSGKKFDRWTVLAYTRREKDNKLVWNCVCECGNTSQIVGTDLTSGKTRSCGCFKKENTSRIMKTHGMSTSIEYRHYAAMLSRCTNPTNQDYEMYAGRGITVCQHFMEDFLNFYNEIGPKPEGKWSVGRIDNTQGYNVGNIRWETDNQQARNHSLQKNNTSGYAGVTVRHTEQDGSRVIARYSVPGNKKKRVSKSFSINKLGYEKAMSLAIEWRNEMIKMLNDLGAEYGENHGRAVKFLEGPLL